MTLPEIEQTFEGHVEDSKDITSLHFKNLLHIVLECKDDNNLSELQSLIAAILALAAAVNYQTGINVASNQDTQKLLKDFISEFSDFSEIYSDKQDIIADNLFEIAEAINTPQAGKHHE